MIEKKQEKINIEKNVLGINEIDSRIKELQKEKLKLRAREIGNQTKTIIKNFKDLKESEVFDIDTVYVVHNLAAQSVSYITGMQCSALFSLNDNRRRRFELKELGDEVEFDELIVKFHERIA